VSVSFFTIAHGSSLPHARVLAERLAEHHGGARFVVLNLGRASASGDEPFDALSPQELKVSGWEELANDHRWADLTEFFKPHMLDRLIGEGADVAVYLDVSVDLHARLDREVHDVIRHAAVLSTRRLGPVPTDGRHPSAEDLRAAGRLGASMIALGRHAMSPQLLEWWAKRLRRVTAAVGAGPSPEPRFACRELTRWIDLAPSMFSEVAVSTDPGSAISYWNLDERHLERDDLGITADDRPLRFLHFEGFDPARPFLLSTNGERVRASANPILAELCESYSERLLDAGWRDNRRRADVGRKLPNGMVFDDRLSHLLAEAADAGVEVGDIFSGTGFEALYRWLEGPAPRGAAFGINRYMYRVYQERDDLQRVYPELDSSGGEGFVRWAWAFGAHEMALPPDLMPPAPPGVDLTPQSRRAKRDARRKPLPRGPRPDLSVEVTGLLTGTLGLGEAARGYVRALEAADIPVSTSTVDVRQFVSLSPEVDETYARVEYTDLNSREPAGFGLICINADELPRFAESAGEGLLSGRPAIGVWAWETDHIPERWSSAFGLLDEIWVYSNYVAENLGRAAPIPVIRVPPPVTPPDPGDVELDLAVPEGFQFLFMFDFFSTIQRKNPTGLIEAFRRAFEPGEGPRLVVKTINGVHRPDALEEVLWAARERPDVHVIDRSLNARERDALVARCDCYVSLHRSEGFGLTLAECMALGKPVIGTAFSGPIDFMTEENSYRVPYRMIQVGADCEIYPAEGTWADPDVAKAAELMRAVVEQPGEARAKGERARRDIERLYSAQAIGELIRARLEETIALWPDARAPRRYSSMTSESRPA
jgi:glycosyltransferase involved in cell wall biosynthesis